jgi:hypothetical protein
MHSLAYAAPDSYAREKYLEEGPVPPSTGDTAFDAAYLLLGEGAAELRTMLTQQAREALLSHARIHPDITWLEPISLTQRLVIRAAPPLCLPTIDRWAALGEEPFTARRPSEAVGAALSLATALEET